MSEIAVVTVRIAFSTDPFSASPSWDDVSSDVIAINIKRGRQNQLDRFEAGKASILLKNIEGNYWPFNTGGDYSPNVKLRRRVNIRATYDEVTYDLYTGFIMSYQPGWLSEEGNLYPTMTIECVDLQRNISKAKLNNAGYAQELSGARVGHILTSVGWNATERDIDTGKETMQATGALVDINAMDHLYSVQDSELGIFWMRGDGYAIFQERGARDVSNPSQATFGNGNLPLFEPSFPLDDDLLYNDVRLTRTGGSEQTASDAASILDYGLLTLTKSGLLLTSDIFVYIYCLYFLARFHDAVMRIKSFTVKPQTPGYESQLWPLALGLDISDRITLVWDEAEINGEYFIEGIEHDWDYREQVWKTKYQCSDATWFLPPGPIYSGTEDLSPTGTGDVTTIPEEVPDEMVHWQCVDDAPGSPDDLATYVYGYNASGYDLYALANTSIGKGTIDKIRIYYRAYKYYVAGSGAAYSKIKTGGTEYNGASQSLTSAWVDYYDEYTLNPKTGVAWTWDDINALQAGIYMTSSGGSYARCTQVYIKVYYSIYW